MKEKDLVLNPEIVTANEVTQIMVDCLAWEISWVDKSTLGKVTINPESVNPRFIIDNPAWLNDRDSIQIWVYETHLESTITRNGLSWQTSVMHANFLFRESNPVSRGGAVFYYLACIGSGLLHMDADTKLFLAEFSGIHAYQQQLLTLGGTNA